MMKDRIWCLSIEVTLRVEISNGNYMATDSDLMAAVSMVVHSEDSRLALKTAVVGGQHLSYSHISI